MEAILALQGLEETTGVESPEAAGYTGRGSWISIFSSCMMTLTYAPE